MAEMYAVNGDTLTDIAEAIRLKRDITDGIHVSDMAMQIGLIGGGTARIETGIHTFETITKFQDASIEHHLGEVPKLVIGWCLDEITSFFGQGQLGGCYIATDGMYTNSNGTTCFAHVQYTQANGTISRINISQTSIESYVLPYIDSERFVIPAINGNSKFYQARYQWIVATW